VIISAIPRLRAAHLVPYLERTQGSPLELEAALSKFRLPLMFSVEREACLPLLPASGFLSFLQDRGGSGAPINCPVDDSLLSAESRRAVRSASTLRAAITAFADEAAGECNVLRVWTAEETGKARLIGDLQVPIEEAGLHILQIHFLKLLCVIVGRFAHCGWTPATMGLQHFPSQRFTTSLNAQFPNTRVLFGQSQCWISVPDGLLGSERPANAGCPPAEMTKPLDYGCSASPEGFVTSLKRILRTYLADGYPNIEVIADVCRVSVRTLQRQLAEASTTYSKLVENARLEVAQELLRGSPAKIIDVAYALGYDDPSHFSRAFRRLAGTTPRAYRKTGSLSTAYGPSPPHHMSHGSQ
jgi:AraC-like DNA-binding protein